MVFLWDSLGHLQGSVHPALQPTGAQGLPHQPESEGVGLAATLDALVAGVIADVVELVRLEEVRGVGRVAALKKTLRGAEVCNERRRMTIIQCYHVSSSIFHKLYEIQIQTSFE